MAVALVEPTNKDKKVRLKILNKVNLSKSTELGTDTILALQHEYPKCKLQAFKLNFNEMN